ncbi:MAG: sulfatase-like hydrolase/transferase [Rubripirellula sp.]
MALPAFAENVSYDLIIVAGQSNAVGFDAKPSELPIDSNDERVLLWWKSGDPPPDQHDSSSSNAWTKLQPQSLGHPAPKNSSKRQYGNFAQAEGGFGPEIGFARQLLEEQPSRKVAILKVAFSGTSITRDWDPAKRDVADSCYRAFLTEWKKAKQAATEKNITLRPRALLWVQGESDATANNAPRYDTDLTKLIAAFREDTEAPELTALLAVNTHFGNDNNAFIPAIVEAQEKVAAADSNAEYIDTSSAPIANAAHYNTEGTLQVGRLFAKSLLERESATKTRAASRSRQPPNIICVFIDDMGYSDFSCFGGTVQTQHVDQLASEGIKFTHFYVNSPICSPSRVALTTGQYPHRWRITSFLNNRKDNKKRGMAQWLDPKAPTLARQLQHQGYATGHFGKWHMGGQRDVDEAPPISDYGFDQSLTNFEGMGAKLLPLTLKPGQNKNEPGRIWANAERLGKPFTWMQRSEITTGFVDAALSFVDQSAKSQKPFFINLWPDDVHGPWWPPLDKWGNDKRALYQGVLDSMDEQLARLFDRVRNDKKLRDNTIITVCSDNGHEPGAGTSRPFRGAKTWLYEGGIRSPLIVWAPGLMNDDLAGSTNDESIFSAIDLNRSLYTIAGTQPTEPLDGEDLSQTILGKRRASRAKPIFWRRPPDRPGFGHGYEEDNPDLAVRDDQWKYLVNIDGSDPQLYDVVKDPSESRNLANQHPQIVKQLDDAVRVWNVKMPVDGSHPDYSKTGSLPDDQFINPIGEGADPWIIRDPKSDRYLWCLSDGNRAISIHSSNRLTSLGSKHIVWRAPDSGPYSQEVWAPELHFLDGKWIIYFAASDGNNKNHLAYALESKSDDPLGEYELRGPFATGESEEQNLWAIDMTPLEHKGKRYAIWSGWDAPDSDRQFLYIAEMTSPTKLASQRVRLCSNDDHPWEFTDKGGKGRGLNEAPQVLQSADRTFLTYSCGASWLPTYKLGLLELVGDNPLDPGSWEKHRSPVFQSTKETVGVGHSCFVHSADATDWWHIFHAKIDSKPGWRRAIFAQPFKFNAKNGFPQLQKPTATGQPLPRPAGDKLSRLKTPFVSDLKSGYNYYGHHQFYDLTSDGLLLGSVPVNPINAYRTGEKIVLDALAPDDFSASVMIDFAGNTKGRGAGMLFRVTGASVGYDAHRGYFVAVKPSQNAVLFGKMDGGSWQELKRVDQTLDATKKQHLQITARGPDFTVSLNGKPILSQRDGTYQRGTIGLRVVDIPATFRDLKITSLESSAP